MTDNKISVLIQDLKEHEKQIAFILLKMNWRISEEQKRQDISNNLYKLMNEDRARILLIAKQLKDLEIFVPKMVIHASK